MVDYLNIERVEEWFNHAYNRNIKGLRVTFEQIEPLIKKLEKLTKKKIIGHSEGGIPIYRLSYGSGQKRVLIWSQMHGNEATGTKCLLDLFRLFEYPDNAVKVIDTLVNNCALHFVTLLNPDGAKKFTRVNLNGTDLNRDATKLTAVESKILRKELDDFKPHYCFNLHDQRTIFNVTGTKNPATISFLAPSIDITRKITAGRKQTMGVITRMYGLLKQVIPGYIGRYTDEFYPTATGDNFQKMGYNTILIEAGHYPNDYERETVRKFHFIALLQGLYSIAKDVDFSENHQFYFEIPENDTRFYDVIERNVIQADGTKIDIAYQYDYKVVNDKLEQFLKEIERGDLKEKIGHNELLQM